MNINNVIFEPYPLIIRMKKTDSWNNLILKEEIAQ